MRDRDIIRWTIDWMLAHESSITEDLMATYERESRAEWGGREVRVWKTPSGRVGRPPARPYDQAETFKDAASAASTEVVTERRGISRSTIYRLLKRGPG